MKLFLLEVNFYRMWFYFAPNIKQELSLLNSYNRSNLTTKIKRVCYEM